MQPSGTNIRSAEFMKLPGPGYGDIAGVQVKQLLIHREVTLSSLKVNDFNPFIPMCVQAPVL